MQACAVKMPTALKMTLKMVIIVDARKAMKAGHQNATTRASKIHAVTTQNVAQFLMKKVLLRIAHVWMVSFPKMASDVDQRLKMMSR
jgi:hypothetical protein